jgi:hypothetical protein
VAPSVETTVGRRQRARQTWRRPGARLHDVTLVWFKRTVGCEHARTNDHRLH